VRLLLAEDDLQLRDSLSAQLRAMGYAVDLTPDGREALFLGQSEPYDVIILDLGLPEIGGMEVLRRWRAAAIATPVLILTARDTWHEKVDGLRAGADDYLTKPFHVEELIARLQALLRRSSGRGDPQLRIGRLTLDESRQQAALDDRTITLTATEFRLLRYLMLHPDRVLSASRLVEHVYDFNDEKESNVIEVYIGRLRRKLGREAIGTRRGQGYFLRSQVLE